METINNNTNSLPSDTLAPILQSAVFINLEQVKKASINTGNRFIRMVKKGKNSKLPETLFVEVPNIMTIPALSGYPAITSYLLASYHELEKQAATERVIAGDSTFNYSNLSLSNLELVATRLNEATGNGHISEDRINTWFEADARELLLVAISEWLGMGESVTDADVLKCEQIANQLKGNLAKLSSKKPVLFPIHIKNALNKALTVLSGDDFASRLSEKLNVSVNEEDMLLSLGM